MIYIVDVAKLRVGSDKAFVKGDRINLTNDMAAKLIRKAYVKFDTESSKNVIVESDSNESNVSIHTTNESNFTGEEQKINNENDIDSEGPSTDLNVEEYIQNNEPSKKK